MGKQIKSVLKRAKDGIKQIVVPGMLFEELGLTYMGPVDGHNISEIIEHLETARNLEGPILMHVITKRVRVTGLRKKGPMNSMVYRPSILIPEKP